MRAQRLFGFMAFGLVLASVGCGGDSDTMDKQEWVLAADAVCVDMNTELEGISEPKTIEEFAAAQSQVKDVWRSGLADLEDLGLPVDDEAAAAEVLNAFDELVNVSVEFADAIVETGSGLMVPGTTDEMTPEVETLFRDLEAASENATRHADAYGLEHCFDDQAGGAVEEPPDSSSAPSEPNGDTEAAEPGDEPPAPDPSTLPEATAPSGLGTPELPEDADEVAALFNALPQETLGADREIVTLSPGTIAANYDAGDKQCTQVGLQAIDLTVDEGGFYPQDWRAEHIVALFASGADWDVEEAGHEGVRYWVTFESYCGGEDMEHDEIISSAAWGDEGSATVFFVGASDAADRDVLLTAFVEAALAAVEAAD